MEEQEDREQAIIRIRRQHNLRRMWEALAMIASMAALIAIYACGWAGSPNSDTGALWLVVSLVALIVSWFGVRRLIGARPFIANESDFARWANEERKAQETS